MSLTYTSGFGAVAQLVQLVAITPGAVNNAATADISITVGGSTPDMAFQVLWPSLDSGIVMGGARCDVAGTVKVRLGNVTGAPITPAAVTVKVMGF
jgi:hypothetical protein